MVKTCLTCKFEDVTPSESPCKECIKNIFQNVRQTYSKWQPIPTYTEAEITDALYDAGYGHIDGAVIRQLLINKEKK